MTVLTQEYLDKSLKSLPTKQEMVQVIEDKIKHLPTKQDVEEIIDRKTKNFARKNDLKNLATKTDVKDAVEELARIVNTGLEDVSKRLDVRGRTTALEKDMGRIKDALRIK